MRRKSRGERADSTYAAYRKCWRCFCQWCGEAGVNPYSPSPAEIVAFMRAQEERGMSPATIDQQLAAVAASISERGVDLLPTRSLTVEAQMRDIRSRAAPAARIFALSHQQWRQMMDACGQDWKGKRNRAVLAYLWGVPEGRGSAHLLMVSHLVWSDGQLVGVWARGHLKEIARSYRPVLSSALIEYMRIGGLGVEGPVFRHIAKGGRLQGALSDHWINQIVKDCAEKVGLSRRVVSAGGLRKGRIRHEEDRGTPLKTLMRLASYRSSSSVFNVVR
jgi:integrase